MRDQLISFSERRAISNVVDEVNLPPLLAEFFAYTGLRADIGLINSPMLWAYCIAIIVFAALGKIGATALALRLAKTNSREAIAIGALVNTRGLVELVVLNVGLDLRIISTEVFSMMLIMAVVTTFMTAPLLAWAYPVERLKA